MTLPNRRLLPSPRRPYPSPNTPSAIPSSTLGCVSSASASFQMTSTVGFLAPLSTSLPFSSADGADLGA